jgi:hypothetical protein
LKSLLDRLPEVGYTVYVINSPFSSKDALKARQYRWDAEVVAGACSALP